MTRLGRTLVPLLRAVVHVGIVLVVLGASVLGMAPPASAATVRDAQWYLDAMEVPRAHVLSRGEGVVVAVVDSGVEASVPDLAGQVLPGVALVPGAGTDGRRDPDRTKAHGTEMAGIIAGRGDSPTQVLGFAPGAKILPVAVGALGTDQTLARGIRWAADHGADVLNLSVTGGGPGSQTEAAVGYAQARDVVVVASAGNTSLDGPAGTPLGTLPGVVTVSGSGRQAEFWSGSSYGTHVALAAPAVDVISPTPRSASSTGFSSGNGTSASAAIVSGTVALIRSRFPDLDAANVINRLIRTAKDQGAAGRDPQFGFGTVRPYRALTDEVPSVDANPLGQVQTGATDGNGLPGVYTPAETGVRWDRVALAGGFVVLMLVGLVGGLLVFRSRRRGRPHRQDPRSPQPRQHPPHALGPPPEPYGHPPQGYGPPPHAPGPPTPDYGPPMPPATRPPGSGP
ncbi:MAG TPA: S8 family serine peptidase [Mycobacteriales bacterium]|nr:S8 family serine peptidase [Mycobacteriales bacterium]